MVGEECQNFIALAFAALLAVIGRIRRLGKFSCILHGEIFILCLHYTVLDCNIHGFTICEYTPQNTILVITTDQTICTLGNDFTHGTATVLF